MQAGFTWTGIDGHGNSFPYQILKRDPADVDDDDNDGDDDDGDDDYTEAREEDQFDVMKVNWSLAERESSCNGTLSDGCYTPHYVPDVFFFSCLIFLGTFVLSFYLKLFRNTRFFPNKVRRRICIIDWQWHVFIIR